jgi:protein-L-isoaspartate O-methyltransferase
MPYLYVNDAAWEPKAREAQGWVQLFRDTHGYDHAGDDIHWPYVDAQPWLDNARMFDIALDLLQPKPGARVLDLGAG